MSFLKKLTDKNLIVMSFLSMKNTWHRKIASDVMCSTYFDEDSLWTCFLSERTTHRFIHISKTAKGIWFIFVVEKVSGIIRVIVHRHRNNVIIRTMILNHCQERISNDIMFFQDCNENWIKVLLFEFGDDVVNYLKRFSAKNKDLREFTHKYMMSDRFKLVVHIDIPGYILFV